MPIKISREDVIKHICSSRLSGFGEAEIKNTFINMQEIYDEDSIKDDMVAKVILKSIKYEFRGAPNDYLACVYEEVMGQKITVYGRFDKLLPCPCCNARSLTELYDPSAGLGYDICENCGWEDDGTSIKDIGSSVNRGTMNDYLAKLQGKEGDCKAQRWEFESV